jgi:uncharacterized protein YbjT (DUF2867 family)
MRNSPRVRPTGKYPKIIDHKSKIINAMRVLVTGGTGFVGRTILHELHRAGHKLHVLSHRGHTAAATAIEEEFGGQIHHGNILDLGYLDSDLRGSKERIDAVIHLVGIISEVGEQTFENIHVVGTQKIVEWAKRSGIRRLIHMSALGTRPGAIARYHKSKWAAEEIVRESGLDWTIFRPSIIYGAGDGFVNLFARMMHQSPIVPIVENGNTKFQPVPVEAVAVAFVRALTEQQSIGQTFDLTGPETLTLNQIVDTILEVTGKTRFKVHLPFGVAWCQAAFLEFFFARLLHRAPPLNRDQLLMLREDNVGNGKPAEQLFGLSAISFQDGIARYLAHKS